MRPSWNERTVAVTYPPDFDGELHIKLAPAEGSLYARETDYDAVRISLTINMREEETPNQALYRAACDIVRYLGAKR